MLVGKDINTKKNTITYIGVINGTKKYANIKYKTIKIDAAIVVKPTSFNLLQKLAVIGICNKINTPVIIYINEAKSLLYLI